MLYSVYHLLSTKQFIRVLFFFLLQFMTTIEVENQIIFRGIIFSKVYLLMDRYVVGISKKKINVIGKYSQICIMRSPLGQKKVAF